MINKNKFINLKVTALKAKSASRNKISAAGKKNLRIDTNQIKQLKYISKNKKKYYG